MHNSIYKIILIFIILYIFPIKGFGKNEINTNKYTVIDSLKKEILISKEDSTKAKLYNEIGRNYKLFNVNEALKNINEALTIANKNKNTLSIQGKSHLLLSEINRDVCNYQLAIAEIYKALDIFEKLNDKSEIAYCYLNLGVLYKYIYDYPIAIKTLEIALQKFILVKDKFQTVSTLILLGHVNIDNYKITNNFKYLDNGIEYYSKALKSSYLLNFKSLIASSNIALANVNIIKYEKTKNKKYLDISLDYTSRSMLAAKDCNDNLLTTINFLNLAQVYSDKNQFEQSNIALDKALKSITETNNTNYILEALHCKINNYTKLKNYNKALEHLNLFYKYSVQVKDLVNISYYYEMLSDIKFEQKNIEEGRKYRDLYEIYKDSIFNEKKINDFNRIQIEYNTKKKDDEILLLNKDKILTLQKAKEEQTIKYFLFSLIGIFTILLLTIYNRFKIKEKTNKIIAQKNIDLENLSIVANEIDNLVIISNNNNILEWTNNGFNNFLGWTTIQEFNANNPTFSEDINTQINLIKNIKDPSKIKQSIEFKHKLYNNNGNDLWIKTTLTPIYNNNKLNRILLHGTNITEIENAKETAENALKIQEQFLANTSHEIRTPINGIIGMTNQLYETKLNNDQESYLAAIKQSSFNLLNVVNDVLDLSKIRAGKIEYENNEFILKNIFDNLYITNKHKVADKNLQLSFLISEDIPKVIIGDAFRLNQILLNLIGNAIKFTESGTIKVSCNIASKSNNLVTLLFTIEDSGIGIPENKLNYIFESFAQAESNTSRKFGGTGLGLSISKSLIEQQYGEINVESIVNKGTKFTFTIPFGIGNDNFIFEKNEINNNISEEINLSKYTVLLVEDDLINQKVALFYLNKMKLNILCAETAEIALEIVEKNNLDLILMDLKLPGMSGIEATKYIRNLNNFHNKNIPIIALTANAFSSEKDNCIQAGMNDYVSKPYTKELLFNKITTYIN